MILKHPQTQLLGSIFQYMSSISSPNPPPSIPIHPTSVATEDIPSCIHCSPPSNATGIASCCLAPQATPRPCSCSSCAAARPSASHGSGARVPRCRARRLPRRARELRDWRRYSSWNRRCEKKPGKK